MVRILNNLNCFHFTKMRWYYKLFNLIILYVTIVYIWKICHSPIHKSNEVIPDGVKTILFWDSFFGVRDYGFGFGREPFVYKCYIDNCYTTNNRDLKPLDQFDAIIFHGPDYSDRKLTKPEIRSPSQVYVFFSMEAPLYRPVKNHLNGFFNRTMTIRLDSDFITPYMNVLNYDGFVVAPSLNPSWLESDDYTNGTLKYLDLHKKKSKPVAWFVSNCQTFSGRDQYVAELQKYVKVDVYGQCGNLSCPKKDKNLCNEMLRDDYYFYLAMENSICVDYITEKVKFSYQYDIVPIYYGGANLTRFLPPDTYINALHMPPQLLANLINYLINNPEEYVKYLWYKDYYIFENVILPFCELCEFLNNSTEKKVYDDLQTWWNGPNGNLTCKLFDFVNKHI